MKKVFIISFLTMFLGAIFSVLVSMSVHSKSANSQVKLKPAEQYVQYEIKKTELPEEVEWITNTNFDPPGSPEAKKGGSLYVHLGSFPQTFRVVGPNSNTMFRDNLTYNNMYLVTYHPVTKEIVPGIATHWAFGKDRKTVYYKIDKRAKWSDGRPVTAHDFLYIKTFMRSKHINAPWYNNYYSTEIADIIAYDSHTIAVKTGNEKPQDELIGTTATNPLPSHFYKLDENWEKDYNWAIAPNTGPYEITDYKKGDFIVMERKKDWWAGKDPYYKYRFNVDRVVFKVIRSENLAYIYFKKGEIDYFPLTMPKWWHVKAKGKLFDNGFLHKRWFYITVPEGVGGLFMNVDHPILSDNNVRQGIAHSINMEGMIRDVLKGDYLRMQRFTEGFEEYDVPDIQARKYDLLKADEYFKKAGWVERNKDGIRVKDGKTLSFTVTFGFEGHMPRLTYLREEARKAGLELKIELLDSVANYRKISTKEHEMCWIKFGGGGLKPRYHQFFHSSYASKPDNNNLCNVSDPELDKLIMAYREEFDLEKAKKLCEQIQRKIYEICPIVYSYSVPYHRTTYWSYWKFPEIAASKFSETLFDPFLGGGFFWLDQEEKARVMKEKILGRKGEPLTIIDEMFMPGVKK